MKKVTISDLFQAEDKQIVVNATIDSNPIIDVASALLVVQDADGNEALRLTLGSGITFSNSAFTLQLTDTNTADLVGKYQFELWFTDSAGVDTLAIYGSMKFAPTFGRYN
ncbi:hypothetical protein [Bowmanella sp. JS7-9]|uniref:BppU N-terminal domain-containing protein n=1 Tax=Pseudobowmanella zhangzhouensis TaxID=1537679 RepID=A0ABW1XP03_9ALTE|nr:hypothetical protein [Bowmanella sp. JS7-9]TBX21929.1 hypothetical protein TK45_10600 [Bowmanella sp. JS7-9]